MDTRRFFSEIGLMVALITIFGGVLFAPSCLMMHYDITDFKNKSYKARLRFVRSLYGCANL